MAEHTQHSDAAGNMIRPYNTRTELYSRLAMLQECHNTHTDNADLHVFWCPRGARVPGGCTVFSGWYFFVTEVNENQLRMGKIYGPFETELVAIENYRKHTQQSNGMPNGTQQNG